MERVPLNLLTNAITFTPAGGSIGLNACRSAGYVTISVTHTGGGIPRTEQAKLALRDEAWGLR